MNTTEIIAATLAPLTDEELEAKALADYEAGVAQVAAEPQATEVRLEIDGQVYTYQSAGGSERDAYLRKAAKRLTKAKDTIEKNLERIRQEAGV